MQVALEEKPGLERVMTIEVPITELDAMVNKRLEELATQVRLPGFRADKPVPMRAVKQRYGEEIKNEAQSMLMIKRFFDIVEERKIEPAGEPNLEPVMSESADTFKFRASFEVIPAIALNDISGVSIERLASAVSDEDITKTIEHLREQNRTWQAVTRPSQKGDRLILDFVGRIDGKEMDRGTATDFHLELGSDTMIPGFEAGLYDKKPDEEVRLNLTFPKDYHHDEIAGKDVEFDVTIKTIEEGKLPEVDAEFCKIFHVAEGGVDELKANIKKNLERQGADIAKSKNKDTILAELLAANDIDAPAVMVDKEIERRIKMSREMAEAQQNPEFNQVMREMMREEVTRAVKIGLLLRAFISSNQITVTEQETKDRIQEMAQNYESPEEYLNWFYTDKERVKEAEAAVIEDKAIDLLFAQVKTTDKTLSYHELVEQPKVEQTDK